MSACHFLMHMLNVFPKIPSFSGNVLTPITLVCNVPMVSTEALCQGVASFCSSVFLNFCMSVFLYLASQDTLEVI